MTTNREMPKYECHKKVWALKIAGIVGDQHGGVYFQPAEEGYDKVPLSPEYVAKHKPEVGGYYVVYEDGYKSFAPCCCLRCSRVLQESNVSVSPSR